MTIEHFYSFAIFAFVASITPGPNNILLTAAGVQLGFWRGLPAAFGIIFGFAIMIFALTLSLGWVLELIQEGFGLLRYAGLALLVWIAFGIATAPVSETFEADGKANIGMLRQFIYVALFQWLNPKAWFVVSAALLTYLDRQGDILEQAFLFAFTFVGMAFISCICWLSLGALLSVFLHNHPFYARLFNILMGLLLLLSVLLEVF